MNMILKTTALCKNFKGQRAVNNVNIHIERNSVYGLLGPNGAGKSTILKMITGILRPTSGEIEFNGHPWSRKDLNSIGALIEMPPLYENLTAYENLKARTLALNLPEGRIDEVLEIVQLQNTDKKRAGHFSLGMKQRLGIALALLVQPKLLILDEPTNGLDPIGIQDLRQLIRSFPTKGITVILSSHILSEVELIADHIGILSNGKLGYESVSVKYLVSFNESSILLYLEKLLKEESSWIRKLTSSVLKTGSASFWKPITAVFPKQNGADKITSAARHSFTGRERSVSWKHRKHYPLLSFLPYLQDKRQPYHLISLI